MADITREAPVDADPANTGTAAANTAVALTFSAPAANARHVITGIVASYSAAPTAGGITITDGGTTVFQIDITAAGEHVIAMPAPIRAELGNAVVVTLAAGGGTAVGKLNVVKYTATDVG